VRNKPDYQRAIPEKLCISYYIELCFSSCIIGANLTVTTYNS